MSRSLDDLRPEIRPKVDAWLAACTAAGIDVLVTCTLRSNEDQAVLYAQGRTTAGHIVTKAKPGQSAHNFGLAIDIVPMIHGKPDWLGTSPAWHQVGVLGQAQGLEWYGAPGALFPELPHFTLSNWRQLAGIP